MGYYQKLHIIFDDIVKALEVAGELAGAGNLSTETWEKVTEFEVEKGVVLTAYEQGFQIIEKLEANNAFDKAVEFEAVGNI
jgi:hypothetical protein